MAVLVIEEDVGPERGQRADVGRFLDPAQGDAVLAEATLKTPCDIFMQQGGKRGVHTEHLGHLLAKMQTLQRTFPGARW